MKRKVVSISYIQLYNNKNNTLGGCLYVDNSLMYKKYLSKRCDKSDNNNNKKKKRK